MIKVKFLFRQVCRKVQRKRNILAILVLFVCTSICLGNSTIVKRNPIIVNRDIGKCLTFSEYHGMVMREVWALEKWKKWKDLGKKLTVEDRKQKYKAMEEAKKKVRENSIVYRDIAGNGDPYINPDPMRDNYGKEPLDGLWKDPNNNRLIIKPGAKVGNAYGAKMNAANVKAGVSISMTNNEVIVNGGEFGCGRTNGDIAGACADNSINDDMNVSSNTVRITGGSNIKDVFGGCTNNGIVSSNTVTIKGGIIDINGTRGNVFGGNVYGGYIHQNGTAIANTVNLTCVTVSSDVYGAKIGNDEDEDEAKKVGEYGLASSNTVTITSGTVGQNVYGGYIVKNGTATLNKVNLTDVDITRDVYGARIGKDGDASSNEVTITGGSGKVGRNVYDGYIVNNGTATGNTVTINGGKIVGSVFGGYVGGNGKATHNTINITATEQSSSQSFPEFSPESILCGGICAPNATTNDAVTGNTLNIETKGVVVKGISNFEKYKFHLKDIKAGETILTATSGGCSWNTVEHNYTSDCAVDLLRSNIYLHTQGVLNKGDQYTLIKSPHGFEGKVETKQCDFENEGLLIKYYWDIKIADNKQELTAKLIDKKIRDEGIARSLSEGYGAGVVCVNNGMDCIFSKMEETEEQSPKSLLGEGA